MSKCDLDPGGRGLVDAHDTSFYYNKHFCQVILDSFEKLKRLWTRHKIYPVIDYVNILPPSVTLVLKVGDRLLRMTNICYLRFL
jgi:hypothetical protein